jgi:hypothetical protein
MKYLIATRKRKRISSSYNIKKHGNKLITLIYNRIVDLTFPSLALNNKNIEPKKAGVIGEERARKRKVTS